MSEFGDYFQLKQRQRTSFELNTDKDYDIFVDLDGIRSKVESITDDPYRLVVEGDFGTGKSHLLRFLEHHLPDQRLRPFYVKLSGFGTKADFILVYRQIMDVLFPILVTDLSKLLRKDRLALKECLQDADLFRAFESYFILNITDSPDRRLAERWIKADPDLRAQESTRFGYRSRLVNRPPTQLVAAILSISKLYHQIKEKKLLLLLDESESFSRLTDDVSQANIATGLRELFDPENEYLGVVVGLNTPSSRSGHHPMLRSEVRTRLLGKYLRLRALDDPERILQFVRELWIQLAEDPESATFLLSEQSQILITRRIREWREVLDPKMEAKLPVVARDLTNILTVMGQQAVRLRIPPPIKTQQLKQCFGDSER